VPLRLRCHGDYNLGEILYTGKDFMIIDLEGLPSPQPGRSPHQALAAARRGEHGALLPLRGEQRLVGGWHRSRPAPGVVRPEDLPILEPWAWTWHRW